MAQAVVKLTRDTMTPKLQAMIARLKNPRVLLEPIRNRLIEITRRSFDGQKSPDGKPWVALSPKWAARKNRLRPGRKILQFSGALSGPTGTFTGIEGNTVFIATRADLVYGRIHQEGGRAGRNRSAKIPARPFLGFPKKDQDEIASDAEQAVLEGGAQ